MEIQGLYDQSRKSSGKKFKQEIKLSRSIPHEVKCAEKCRGSYNFVSKNI